jgi:Zn-dependent protease with chaperone function
MMKFNKIAGTLFIFFLLMLIAWVEEVILTEGTLSKFLYLSENKALRFLIRGLFGLLIFFLGYSSIKNFQLKWLELLWIWFYVVGLFFALIRVLLDVLIHKFFNDQICEILSFVYMPLFTPLPYIVIYVLYLAFNKGQQNIDYYK